MMDMTMAPSTSRRMEEIQARLHAMEQAMARVTNAVEAMGPRVAATVVAALQDGGFAEPVLATRASIEAIAAKVMLQAPARASPQPDVDVTSIATPTPAMPPPSAPAGRSSSNRPSQQIEVIPLSPTKNRGSTFQQAVISTHPPRSSAPAPCSTAAPRVLVDERTPASKHNSKKARDSETESHTAYPRLYLWGNAWHHVPEAFELPRESVQVVWRQWCCGDEANGLLPLQCLESSDLSSNNNRKRLSDLRFLMRQITGVLKQCNVWKDTPTTAEADQMLLAACNVLPISGEAGEQGRKRRFEDMKWHSAVKLLRTGITTNKKARLQEPTSV